MFHVVIGNTDFGPKQGRCSSGGGMFGMKGTVYVIRYFNFSPNLKYIFKRQLYVNFTESYEIMQNNERMYVTITFFEKVPECHEYRVLRGYYDKPQNDHPD